MAGIDLGLIGNCSISALINPQGEISWLCLPRFDGDPVFHSLLGTPEERPGQGRFSIELEGVETIRQRYLPNTAILETVMEGPSGSIQIHDFAPRFKAKSRYFRPQMIIRRVRPLSGSPRVTVKLRPSFDYGRKEPTQTWGSNHIRYVGAGQVQRLTTDMPVDYIRQETPFVLNRMVNLIFGPDESLGEGINTVAQDFQDSTAYYWRDWVKRLALPFEWQEAVIRAAITLKLCAYESTGAIVAAMTTSIPEAPHSGRNWDYRFCWVRDAFFTVRALNSLAAVRTMETYVQWLINIIGQAPSENEEGHIQPVYGIGLEAQISEWIVEELPGFEDMGPVRIGNQAHEHYQHDTYGQIILGASQAFFDQRIFRTVGHAEFERLEVLGEQAWALHDQPDAGIWELRTRARIHTSSSVMCWAACDRLAKIADEIQVPDRATYWAERATTIREKILEQAWSEERQAFVESFGGKYLDASVLLMSEVGFIDPMDERFIKTVEALDKELGRGPFMLRYQVPQRF
ncbi:MAG: glycoside hydrolase family 15 protein [Pseudomonadota bacterium]